MPNKTIYLNTIKEMEEKLGRSFIDVAAVATKLQNAWKEDTSENKTSFLNTYGEVFRSVMKELGDYELSLAYDSRAKDGAKLRTALLNADETMKMCALALIPELRQDQATLTNMTFGAMNQGRLTREFLPLRAKYLSMKRTSPAMKKYKAEVYEKYKKEWENTSIRKITERIRDKTALKAMSQDEKIDFAVALNIYRNDKTLPRPLGSNEAEWIDDALNEWKRELGCLPNDPIDELAANRFFQYGATIGNEGAIDAEVNAAFEEYNKRPTPAQKEIDHFNEVAEITAEFKRVSEQTIKTEGFTDEVAQGVNDFFWDGTETEEEREQREAAEKKQKEHTIKNEGVTDDTAEMVGDFFRKEKEKIVENKGITDDTAEFFGDFFVQEELKQEIEEVQQAKEHQNLRKEREYLEGEVKAFNQKYGMTVNNEKLRTSSEQVAALMIAAREEKERFLSKESIVVVENGKTKYYKAKDYFKDYIEGANKTYVEKMAKLDAELAKANEDYVQFRGKVERQGDILTAEGKEAAMLQSEKALKTKTDEIKAEMAKAKELLNEELSATEGGLVIEKDGNTVRRHKASQYYETHETKKEQEAYGEYQQMYARVFRDACQKVKEENYAKGKVTDFVEIAKDVDKLFKSGMFLSNMYDNEKNVELMQKCSFGGFTPEQLAGFTTESEKDPWALNQSSEEAWTMQKAQAKKILAGWTAEEKANPKVKPSDRIKETLEKQRTLFEQGKISRKEMLDYIVATDAHFQQRFASRSQRFFSFIQYYREKNALKASLAAVGVKDNAALRVEMNGEYVKMAESMSKEQVFKSIEKTVNDTPDFKKEKEALAREHQVVQDKKLAEKMQELEQIKTSGREPISIPELDARKEILGGDRVKPITPSAQKKKDIIKTQ